MKKIVLLFLVTISSPVLAQPYPSPTFSALTLQTPLSPANGGSGATSSTGTGSLVLGVNPTIASPTLTTPAITGGSMSGTDISGVTDPRIPTGPAGAAHGSVVFGSDGSIVSPALTTPDLLNGAESGTLSFLNVAPALNTTYATGGLTNGNLIQAGGNYISYCPVLSCVTSPSSDHQRTSGLFWATTQDDGHSEEQTVAIETIVQTGQSSAWAPNTAYALGANVVISAQNAVYRATQAGTSASTGAGPTGTGSSIADGTVIWSWINAAAIDAKVGLYNEESVAPGAGSSWDQANNVTLQPGMVPSFNINTELDFRNNAATCNIGVANCNSLEMNVDGNFQSTTGIHLTSGNAGSVFATHWGLRLNGAFLASDADIEDDSAAAVGLGFNASGLGGSHSTATISDASTGTRSILMSGLKTSADISDTSASPTAFVNVGVHSLGVLFENSTSPEVFNTQNTHSAEVWGDTSTSPAAVNLSGTYSQAAITTAGATTGSALLAGAGQNICLNGTTGCWKYVTGTGLTYQAGGTVRFTIADSGATTSATSIKSGVVTVATLPTCNAAAAGTRYAVSDAVSPTFLGGLTGGGTVEVPTVCNGTAWLAG